MTELLTGTLTFLFTDLERSTRLWEEQPGTMQGALARHDTLLAEAVAQHGGIVIKGTGDGVHAVFATADQAVAAAIAGQRAIGTEEWGSVGPLRVRMGLHTGVAEARGGDYYGPVLNRAARLMGLAHGGQVLCSQATADLVRDSSAPTVQLIELGPHSLRDLDRPETIFQVAHPELPATFPRLPTVVVGAGNVPRQLTSFVGHDEDLLAIPSLLDETPLVTLTGVGGVGKTRLAIEIASATAHRFRDGAWICELARVRDAAAVAGAWLETFRIEPRQGTSVEESLVQFLAAKELLVVLDNCEHLLQPVATLVRTILRECPGVRVLATSREGLGLSGERILAVGSLGLPGTADDLDAIAASEAVRLFVERAQAARAGFAIDKGNATAVAEVCRRLDGVPLAIELAAARITMLTPDELARRLDQRFRLLTGSERGVVERHQTLRAAIDWSYELLDESEQQALNRLSVFAGSFSLDAAETVCSGGVVDRTDVFELLAGLVSRSLVQADSTGRETRYGLLETVRQYAQERLNDAGDTELVRASHARWCAAFVEDLVAGRHAGEGRLARESAASETDNVRVALAWAIEAGDVDTLVRFYDCWVFGLVVAEIFYAMVEAAARVLDVPGVTDDPRYPQVLAIAALFAAQRGELAEMARHREALRRCETPRNPAAAAQIELVLTQVAGAEGRIDEWIEHGKRSVELLRGSAGGPDLAAALTNLAIGQTLGVVELDDAAAEADEALAIIADYPEASLTPGVLGAAAFVLADTRPGLARSLMSAAIEGTPKGIAQGLLRSMLSDVAGRLGERRLALEYALDGATNMAWTGLSELLGRNLRRIALMLLDHDPETAAVLLGAGLERSGASKFLAGRVSDAQDRGLAELREALGPERSEQLMARGRSIDDNEAVALARTAATPLLTNESSADTAFRRTPLRADGAGQDAGNEFRRDGDLWVLSYEGESVHLRDAKGLRYLARLLAEPGREVHVSELAGDAVGEAGRSGAIDVVLDDSATRAYRDRIAELERDLEEAREWNDSERAARAEIEIEAITDQLSSAFGLSGRARTTGDRSERVRKAVTNRIKDSLRRITGEHEPLGRHLANSVRTGSFCSYAPEHPMEWKLG